MAKGTKKRGKKTDKFSREKIIDLRIERLRLERERAMLILNKGLIIYFILLLSAIVGRTNYVISTGLFNGLVILGVLILLLSVLPYSKTMHREEDELSRMLDELENP